MFYQINQFETYLRQTVALNITNFLFWEASKMYARFVTFFRKREIAREMQTLAIDRRVHKSTEFAVE